MRKHIPTFIAGTAATVVGGLILSAVSQRVPALSVDAIQVVLAWPGTPLVFTMAVGVLMGFTAERLGAWIDGVLPLTREDRAVALAVRLRDLAEDCEYAITAKERVLPTELGTRVLTALDDMQGLKLAALNEGYTRLPHTTRLDLFANYFLAVCPALEVGKFGIVDRVTSETSRVIERALARLDGGKE